jgi:hypothetical protein
MWYIYRIVGLRGNDERLEWTDGGESADKYPPTGLRCRSQVSLRAVTQRVRWLTQVDGTELVCDVRLVKARSTPPESRTGTVYLTVRTVMPK